MFPAFTTLKTFLYDKKHLADSKKGKYYVFENNNVFWLYYIKPFYIIKNT